VSQVQKKIKYSQDESFFNQKGIDFDAEDEDWYKIPNWLKIWEFRNEYIWKKLMEIEKKGIRRTTMVWGPIPTLPLWMRKKALRKIRMEQWKFVADLLDDKEEKDAEDNLLEPLGENEIEIDMGEARHFRIERLEEAGVVSGYGKPSSDHECATCSELSNYMIQCRSHDAAPWDLGAYLYCSECMVRNVLEDEEFRCIDCDNEAQEVFSRSSSFGLNKGAEDWEEVTDWETHEPSDDPSPFETLEWERLPPPPKEVRHLMSVMEKAGYTILVVGGAVRDALLGLEPKDYDLATNATPDEIEVVVDKLSHYEYVKGPQGEMAKRALTSLVLDPNGEMIEITTFRAELGYEDGNRAKPIAIPAKSFEEDASRRDLTINAMGMDKDGYVKDPTGGKKDLEERVIRAVGNPTERFQEDPLRMIRAIRFSVRFGMPLEPATYQAILDNVDLVSTLSSRRLRDEIGKVLVEPQGFQMLMETGILPVLMPEMRGMEEYHHKLDYHPEDTLYNHYIEAFKKFTTIPNRTELGAWALLFHDIAKPQTADWNEEGGYHTFYGHDKQGAQLVLDRYNNEVGPFEFSKKELQSIAWTTDHHLQKFWESKKPMKVFTMRENENFPLLVEVVTGDTMGIRRGGDEELERRLNEINEITDKVKTQKAKTGNRPPGFSKRLMDELMLEGKEIGDTLKRIEEMIATGEVDSYDQAFAVVKLEKGFSLTEEEQQAHGAGS